MTEVERYQAGDPITVGSALVKRRTAAAERTDGWIDVVQPVAELAEQVQNTEFVPKGLRGKAAAITAAILFGRELDMPPMQALSNVHIVDGRPSLAAEQMRAMVFAAGHEISYPTMTGVQVLARGRRRLTDGSWSEPTTVEWNKAMATAAKLTGKDNWIKYPRAMLTARATAELCRLIFPDVTHGLLATEEIEDGGQEAEGSVVSDTGQDEPRGKVSRRGSAGTSKRAPGVQTDPPVRTDSAPGAPPRPPLPGAAAVVDGSKDPNAGEPSTNVADPEVTPDAPVADLPAAEKRQCPHISNGQQCRYYADHAGKHTYGGGLGDPVSPKRCELPHEHEPHAWNPKGNDWFTCSGEALFASEGDGSPDDVAATGTDEAYAASVTTEEVEQWERDDAQTQDAEVVPERPEGIHPGQKRALEAAFGSLKVTDRAQRHHAASALLGRKVTTFKPRTEDEGGLSADDGSKLLNLLARVATIEALENLIQHAAEKWGEDGADS